jgi:hypothetical protein
MARKLRVQYPGTIYHVMNRRDRLFGEWGIPMDSPAGREQIAGEIEACRRAEGGKIERKTTMTLERTAARCSWARPRTSRPE